MINDNTAAQFNFVASVGGELYYAVYFGGNYFRFNDFSPNNIATLTTYNVGNRINAATWNSNHTISSAQEFANTFTAIFHSSCDNEGNYDYNKIKFAWSQMEAAYSLLDEEDQTALHKSEPASLQDFATLYDTIFKKYANYDGFGSDFADRKPGSNPASKYVTSSVFDNENTKNIVIVVSISGVSLSIVGLYFFLRKRKEDK